MQPLGVVVAAGAELLVVDTLVVVVVDALVVDVVRVVEALVVDVVRVVEGVAEALVVVLLGTALLPPPAGEPVIVLTPALQNVSVHCH